MPKVIHELDLYARADFSNEAELEKAIYITFTFGNSYTSSWASHFIMLCGFVEDGFTVDV